MHHFFTDMLVNVRAAELRDEADRHRLVRASRRSRREARRGHRQHGG